MGWRKKKPVKVVWVRPPYLERIEALQAGRKNIKAAHERIEQEKAHASHREKEPRRDTSKSSGTWQVSTRKEALEVLELNEEFTQDELKARWRTLLKKNHPDAGGSNLMLRVINQAYEVLK